MIESGDSPEKEKGKKAWSQQTRIEEAEQPKGCVWNIDELVISGANGAPLDLLSISLIYSLEAHVTPQESGWTEIAVSPPLVLLDAAWTARGEATRPSAAVSCDMAGGA
jgi:hypothetical protein